MGFLRTLRVLGMTVVALSVDQLRQVCCRMRAIVVPPLSNRKLTTRHFFGGIVIIKTNTMSDLTPMDVESKIISIRNQQVILDCDVAELYGVETKRINEAVSNNPEKFPEGYVFWLEKQQLTVLRSKNSTLKNGWTGRTLKIFPQGFHRKRAQINLFPLTIAFNVLKIKMASVLTDCCSMYFRLSSNLRGIISLM